MFLICDRFSVGSPTQYLGFDRLFSESICYDLDTVIVQFGIQTENRMQAQEKGGGGKWRMKYKTMAEVLGITEEEWRGGFDQQELMETGLDFRNAMREAAKRGEVLDVDAWLAQQEQANADDDD